MKKEPAERAFHRKRRMFAIKDRRLWVARPGVSYSHEEWFKKRGWKASSMEEATRGFVSPEGDVYFYTGYDFRSDKKTENRFFEFLPRLVKRLKLKKTAKVFGGMIKQEHAGQWQPKRRYGIVEELTKKSKASRTGP